MTTRTSPFVLLVVAGLVFSAAAGEAALIGATEVVSFIVGEVDQPPDAFQASFGYLGDIASLFEDIALSPADTGATFSRTVGDDPDFGAISAKLTNGVDEQLAVGFTIGPHAGANFPAESDPSMFGLDVGPGSVDFIGFTVDRIDLVIDEVSVTAVAATGKFGAALRFRYDVFGEPSASVAEPPSVALVVLGAGALALGSVRRRRRS